MILNVLVKISRFINGIALVGIYVSAISCTLMVVLCLSEIFSRTFFNVSISISDELMTWLLVCLVFMGISWTLRTGGHVQITLVTECLPQKVQHWLRISVAVISIVCLIFFCLWAWRGLFENYLGGIIGFTFPLWWAWVPMFVGGVIFTLQLIATLLDSLIVCHGTKPADTQRGGG